MEEGMKETMKAVLLTGYGGLNRLVYREDVPVPVPQRGEVLIRVGAAGINNTDVWTREGAYGSTEGPSPLSGWLQGEAFSFPRIQGGDIAGCIVDVGPGVDNRRVGQRVLVDPTIHIGDGEEIAGVLGSERDGGYAEYVAVPSENAHAIETTLSDAELATFPIAYQTAERMLKRVRLIGGESILITGASGGAGSALVQLAALRQARVIALTSAAHMEEVRDLGADIVLDRGDTHWPEWLRGQVGALDAVADVTGGAAFRSLLDMLRPGGRLVTAGAIAGPIVDLDLRRVYLQRLQIIGSTMGTRSDFLDLVEHIERGRIRPLLADTFPLRDVTRAQEVFASRKFFGKLSLIP
jgi:NADPH:quinone reductase-like Zn-dependent oxidoreductase